MRTLLPVLGLLLGGALAWSLAPTLPPPPQEAPCVPVAAEPSPTEPVSETPRDLSDCAGVAELEARHTYLASQLQNRILQAQGPDLDAEVEAGAPTPWPDNVDPKALEARTETWFEEGLPEELELLEVDCREYPCMIVVRTPPDYFEGSPWRGLIDHANPPDPTCLDGQIRLYMEEVMGEDDGTDFNAGGVGDQGWTLTVVKLGTWETSEESDRQNLRERAIRAHHDPKPPDVE